ncbi:hypothetical protein DRW48_10300 [Paracoccus suum]|uniref:NinB family protein n=2 Tax=Paracoccus suum TaxID=2259340 RepID=A0A344PPA6_9RHOB|nr:hypothetical protein DRW48_10300 [Paracoccus suum]
MQGQTVILADLDQRILAKHLIDIAPAGAVANIREATRSSEQNAKMWAMLSDIARAAPEGRKMPTETWKAAFMSALGHEIMWQPGLDGNPPFPAGFRSSRLTKAQMADLITFIAEYGDRHGVRWSGPGEVAA